MILSNIAEKLGLFVENILVLPGDKGNSSQQMGTHGLSLENAYMFGETLMCDKEGTSTHLKTTKI